MILNKKGDRFVYGDTAYEVGQEIYANSTSAYYGLTGRIIEIRDGDDKETENETADIYCTFEKPILSGSVREPEPAFYGNHDKPMKPDDIALDCVIMAPSMIRPLHGFGARGSNIAVYVLTEDWAANGETGNSSGIYTDYDDAKRALIIGVKHESAAGCIADWRDNDDFIEESNANSYECYLEGEYCRNHFRMEISRQELCVSKQFTERIAEIHKKNCRLEDFVSQVSDWDELTQLTDKQYERMIHDPRFPERLQDALDKNDYYWESYWKTVSEVAHELVKEYLKKPDCYTPETDNPYPLCVGNGTEKCRKCCLYAGLEADFGVDR